MQSASQQFPLLLSTLQKVVSDLWGREMDANYPTDNFLKTYSFLFFKFYHPYSSFLTDRHISFVICIDKRE